MIAQTNWIERKFSFDFPSGFFPMIVERLLGTPTRLEEMTHGVPPGILTRKVNEAWSMQEHAGHLIDLEELHHGRIDDFLGHASTLRSWDTANRKTYEANHNARPMTEILKEFRNGRREFVDRIIESDEELLSRSGMHPRLKVPMRLVDMA